MRTRLVLAAGALSVLLCNSLAFAQDLPLPIIAGGVTTWNEFASWHLYETSKWQDASFSEYEQCYSTPLNSLVLGRFKKDNSDRPYCYYYSIYQWHRYQMRLLLYYGLITCEWLDAQGVASLNMTCSQLQHEFDP